MSEIENKRTMEKNQQTQISKIDKTLSWLTKKKKIQITKIRNEEKISLPTL